MWRPPGDWQLLEAPKEGVLAIGSAEIHGLKIDGQSHLQSKHIENRFSSRKLKVHSGKSP